MSYLKSFKKKLGTSLFNSTDIKLFHAILAFFWMRFNSIPDLQQYFYGLLSSLPDTQEYLNIRNYITDTITNIQTNNQQSNKAIDLIKSLYDDNIHEISYKTAYIHTESVKVSFSDCFETTLRNFINYLVFNIGVSLDTAHPSLKQYYDTYNNITLHELDTPQPFSHNGVEHELSPRDAWALIISNLPSDANIEYKQNTSDYHFEIYSRINNFQNILAYLFNTPFDTLLETLYEDYNLIIDTNITDTDAATYGDINISHGLSSVGTLHIDAGHAYFEAARNENKIKLSYYKIEPHLIPYLNINNYDINPYSESLNIYKLYNFFYMNVSIDTFLAPGHVVYKFHQLKPANITKYTINFYTNYFIYILNNFNQDTIDRYLDKSNIYLLDIPTIHKSGINPDKYKTFMEFTFSGEKYKFTYIKYNSSLPTTQLFTNELYDFTKLTKLTFDYNFEIIKDELPPSLTHLKFGIFHQTLDKDFLPKSLTHLAFREGFNKTIDKDVLPKSLTHLEFGFSFNKALDKDVLPPNLTHLTFGYDFNQPLDKDVLPQSLTHLEFGYKFKQPLDKDVLPPNLTHLTFGAEFNKTLDKDFLPPSITHLKFGWKYRKPLVKDDLPDNLTELSLHTNYPRQLLTGFEGTDIIQFYN